MDALLMCGGRGTRLDADVEKPLFEVGGRPMVDRIRDALAGSSIGTTHAVVSPHAPETRAHLDDLPRIETPGEGYVADLDRALDAVDPPVLTVAADLPLLDADAIDDVLDEYGREDALDERDGGSLSVFVPAALKRRLGASADAAFERDGRELAPTGLNVVDTPAEERSRTTFDVRLAINVNRRSDAAIAEALL